MFYILTTIFLLISGTSTGEELPTIIEIIDEEGQFAFTDGSSTYLFMADGTFYLEPVSISGRTVEGSWTCLDTNKFEIIGLWGWNNGISLINDKRKMIIYLHLLSMKTEVSECLWRSAGSNLFDVYFTIDETKKID